MHKIIWHHTKRISKHTAKKTGHILFPWVVHYLTDKYKGRHHHLVVDTIFSLITIVLIGFNVGLLYWFFLFTTPAELNTELSVPEYVISGSEIVYTIDYHNTSKNISDVSFELISPETFTFKESNLEQKGDEFYLGDLEKFGFGKLEVKGDIIGNIDEMQRVGVIVKYKYHGQEFAETLVKNYKINDSSFEIVTELPDSILNNQEFSWKVHYKNNSYEIRRNVNFSLNLPNTLNITESPENFNSENREIVLEKVDPWQEGDLEFKGIFSGARGESNTLISVTSNLNVNDVKYKQALAEDSIRVLTPRLNISSSVSPIVNIGENFTYRIDCHNIGDAQLTNVRVTAKVDRVGELGLSLYPQNGTVSGDQISWIISSIPAGQTRSVYLAINTNSNLRQQNLVFGMSATAIANIEDLTISTYTQTTSASVKFNSTLNFLAERRYYGPAGEQLGYGPYPMKADEVTAVRVFWDIRDFTNDLENLTIYSTLPDQVEWTGLTTVSQGTNIIYDPTTRKVLWHVSSVPAFSGAQGATFEVRVLPNTQQIGKKINITNETYFSAQDSWTNTIISRNFGSLRTKYAIE